MTDSEMDVVPMLNGPFGPCIVGFAAGVRSIHSFVGNRLARCIAVPEGMLLERWDDGMEKSDRSRLERSRGRPASSTTAFSSASGAVRIAAKASVSEVARVESEVEAAENLVDNTRIGPSK